MADSSSSSLSSSSSSVAGAGAGNTVLPPTTTTSPSLSPTIPIFTRAFLQAYDDDLQVPAEKKALQEELKSRGTEVIILTQDKLQQHSIQLTNNDLIVGDHPFTAIAFKKLGIARPEAPDYPACLSSLLHRRIWQSTLGEMKTFVESGEASAKSIFIKPAIDIKAFSAIIEPKDQMIGALVDGIPGVLPGLPASLAVHCAEVVTFVAEWRAYVVNGMLRAFCQYHGSHADASITGAIDMEVVNKAISTFYATKPEEGGGLAGCGMDFGVIRMKANDEEEEGVGGGKEKLVTALVEVNDGFALGVYDGLTAKVQADLVCARWGQLVGKV